MHPNAASRVEIRDGLKLSEAVHKESDPRSCFACAIAAMPNSGTAEGSESYPLTPARRFDSTRGTRTEVSR